MPCAPPSRAIYHRFGNQLFVACLERLGRREDVRCVVIRGDGGVFCSGADLKYIRDKGNERDFGYLHPEGAGPEASFGEGFKQILEYLHSTISEIKRAPKPFIAAVDGIAAAGGFGIAMACDLVFASERASFEWAYHKTGLTGAESSTFFLPRLIGLRKAMELVLLNPRLDAARARRASRRQLSARARCTGSARRSLSDRAAPPWRLVGGSSRRDDRARDRDEGESVGNA